jgi:hypothetical protein
MIIKYYNVSIKYSSLFSLKFFYGIIRILVISSRRYVLHCSGNNGEITVLPVIFPAINFVQKDLIITDVPGIVFELKKFDTGKTAKRC